MISDEQMETLRGQISVYGTICHHLVHMHKAMLSAPGFRPGQGTAGDPNLHVSGGLRLSARQRWTPSQSQLQLLEMFFEQENGAPSKQRIKEIMGELVQHGHISESNVYNWFQNRWARSKRKNFIGVGGASNALESDGDALLEKKRRADNGSAYIENLGSLQSFTLHKCDQFWSMDEQRGKAPPVTPDSTILNRNAPLEEHPYVAECNSLY